MDSETAEQSPVRNSQKSCRNRKDLRESIPVGLFLRMTYFRYSDLMYPVMPLSTIRFTPFRIA